MSDANTPSTSLVVVGGPTGIGKTRVGIALAKALNGEVISADSVQLFQGFRIGAATPSVEERNGVPHHLLSVLSPHEDISAAGFAARADEAIADVRARGRVPIVVGGSGLYMRALLYGLIEAPPRDDALRAELEAFADAEGNDRLWQTLQEVDPQSANELHPNDRVRVIRALEVLRLTGQSIRATHAAHRFQQPRYRVAGVGLTAPRPYIHERINLRCAQMFQDGLIDEVRGLIDDGAPSSAQPFTAIGYREVLAYLDAHPEDAVDSAAPEHTPARQQLEKDVATHTRRFARRQLVWFRKEPSFRWFNAQHLEKLLPNMIRGCAAFLNGEPWSAGLQRENEASTPDNDTPTRDDSAPWQ